MMWLYETYLHFVVEKKSTLSGSLSPLTSPRYRNGVCLRSGFFLFTHGIGRIVSCEVIP